MDTHPSTRTRWVTASGVTGAVALLALAAAPAQAQSDTEVEAPDTFTSAFTVMATPETVVTTDGDAAPGPEGGMGTFTFMINSDEEIICFDISVEGVTPPYESPARTATHIHEAAAGEPGPPRLAFPNPSGEGDVLTSSGCMQGPFTTGVEGEDGQDTATGFSLAQIEADPAGFSADTHTAEAPAGAVRGQLTEIPVGGVDTGFGGAATSEDGLGAGTLTAGALALAGVAGAGVLMARRGERG